MFRRAEKAGSQIRGRPLGNNSNTVRERQKYNRVAIGHITVTRQQSKQSE